MEKVEGGIFWGRDFTSCTAVEGPNGALYYWQCWDNYMFWINVGGDCEAVGACGPYNFN